MASTTPHNKRQASFEIMRIFAMLLIFVWHIKVHYMAGEEEFHPLVVKAMTLLSSFISFHVDLFVLITGYFGIRNNKRAIVKNLILCTIYLWAFNLFNYLKNGCFDINELIFPISHGPWWFMKVYFLLVLVAPFLERMFSTFEKKEWQAWIIIVLLLNVYFGHYHHLKVVYLMGFDLMNMITIYSIGAFLRVYVTYDNFTVWGGQKTLWGLLLVLIVLRIIVGKIFYVLNLNLNAGEYCAPLTIALAVNVFLLFKQISLKLSPLIFFFSSSAVSVYLITDYPMVRLFLTKIFHQLYFEYCHNSIHGLLFIVAFTIVVFTLCVVIDKVRLMLQKNIEKIVFKR